MSTQRWGDPLRTDEVPLAGPVPLCPPRAPERVFSKGISPLLAHLGELRGAEGGWPLASQ